MKWVYPDEQRKKDESILDYLLRIRNISDPETFLNPDINDLYDWRELHDTTKAAEAILKSIKSEEKIFVHGDFDADGVSGTSILWSYLYRVLGADVMPYIPSRFTEGYGLSDSSITSMIEGGADLVITVDCGIKDLELVSKYTKKGLKFIITDHHTLPVDGKGNDIVSEDAVAVVHPKHPEKRYIYPEISGTTVAWKLICALNELSNIDHDTSNYLGLVALSTVCDVMPLRDENRVLVSEGLKNLSSDESPGVNALKRVGRINSNVESYHLGFVLGPRINAAGRLGSALDAVRLLTTDSETKAEEYAQNLQEINSKRQGLTKELIEQAEESLSKSVDNDLVVFVYGTEWPEGIVGLVAGKLTEKYYKPVMVGSLSEEGIVKASARSIPGFHVADALTELDSLLERYGGHELAAGFSIKEENVDEFRKRLNDIAQKSFYDGLPEKELKVDMNLEPSDATIDSILNLEPLAPFGFSNPLPVFTTVESTVTSINRFGRESQFIKFTLYGYEGVEFIVFYGAEKYSEISLKDKVKFAGNISINEWNGRKKLQFKIIDFTQ